MVNKEENLGILTVIYQIELASLRAGGGKCK